MVTRRRTLIPEMLILLAYLAVRLTALTDTLPVFIDEATLVSRALDMLHGEMFDVLTRGGKWLPVALVALLRPTGPETLWIARGVVALLSILSCAAVIGLGRLLDSPQTGRLAGLMTILTPMALFHERQALADPLMATFVNLSLVMVVLLAKTGRWRYALVAGLTLAAASLSKLTGLIFLALPFAGALFLTRGSQRGTTRVWVQTVAAASLGLTLAAGTLLVLNNPAGPLHRLSTLTSSPPPFVCRHSPLCGSEGSGRSWNLGLKLALFSGIAAYYFGLPMLVLALGSLLRLGGRAWRAAAFMLVPAVGLTLALILVSSWFPARYFNFTVVPLAVLAALGLSGLWGLARRWTGDNYRWRRMLAAAFGLVVALPLGWQAPESVRWLRAPHSASVPPPDSVGCESYGYGFNQVGETLKVWQREHGSQLSVITTSPLQLRPYWGERGGAVTGWNEDDTLRVAIAQYAHGGDAVFFADTVPSKPIPDAPFGAALEVVETVSIPCGADVVRVRRVIDTGPEVRHAIYELSFPNPNDLAEEYRALALYLIETQATGAVVVYPPHQLDLLSNRLQWGTTLDGVYAVGDSWPLEAEDADAALDTLSAEHGDLHVVFLAETNGDPDEYIRAWLDSHLVLVSQDWFGPVELLHYAPVSSS